MNDQPITTNATGATQPDRKLHLKDGELFTTFHDRPEQSFGTVTEKAKEIVDGLTPFDVWYATSPERGEYFGFAALHDLFDANMMLPGAEDADPVNHFLLNGTDEEYGLVTDFSNMITEQVNVILRCWVKQPEAVAAAPSPEAVARAIAALASIERHFPINTGEWLSTISVTRDQIQETRAALAALKP